MGNTKTTFRPILFSTPMVQAILEDRKTMTMRTKGLVDYYPENIIFERSNGWPKQGNWIAKYKISGNPDRFEIENIIKCPYEVGDVFWVRETFVKKEDVYFKYASVAEVWQREWKWKPSIFMPKEACRIFLRLKSIRVERLQDISTEDIKEEGIIIPKNGENILWELGKDNSAFSFMPFAWKNGIRNWHCSKEVFFTHWAELWCKINGRASWDLNPFVFIYKFEQIEKPLDFIV